VTISSSKGQKGKGKLFQELHLKE